MVYLENGKPGNFTDTVGIGTKGFISPEVTLGKKYSLPSDIWSLGCCFYRILTRNKV